MAKLEISASFVEDCILMAKEAGVETANFMKILKAGYELEDAGLFPRYFFDEETSVLSVQSALEEFDDNFED